MRGSIIRRGKDSWLLKFDKGTVDGKRKFHYATVRGTRQDAQRELTRLLARPTRGRCRISPRSPSASIFAAGSTARTRSRQRRWSATES